MISVKNPHDNFLKPEVMSLNNSPKPNDIHNITKDEENQTISTCEKLEPEKVWHLCKKKKNFLSIY